MLEEIARGGMGIVYRARQVTLNRIVAVKMLLFGKFSSDEFLQRFQTEAQAVASLQHPNIVTIHEVGQHEGHHYFSMEYIKGKNLAQMVRDGPLPPRPAAALMKSISEAVHYAHQSGILHRDLKPSNVLIDEFNQPRITDFGLAKNLKGDSELTVTGQVLGSPNYMPPEQADARRGILGARGDVYSLGAILYHLLTGRPPFRAETLEGTLRELLHSEPLAPRLLNPSIPRDLETICLKSLEKSPQKRYESASELARDLSCFMSGEPILARTPSAPERFWRSAKRKPALAITFGFLLAVAAGATLAAVHFNRLLLEIQRIRAGDRLHYYLSDVGHALEALKDGNRAQALLLLKRGKPLAGETDLRSFEWRYAWRLAHGQYLQSLPVHNQVVGGIRFSPNGKLLATYSWDNTLRVWELNSGRQVVELQTAASLGSFLGNSETYVAGTRDGSIYLYQLTTGQRTCILTNAGEMVACSVDGRTIAILDEAKILKVRDSESGQIRFSPPQTVSRFLDNSDGSTVALSSNGRLLAIVQPLAGLHRIGQGIRLWDVGTGVELPRVDERAPIHCIEFSPDAQLLAVGDRTGAVKLWNLTTHEAKSIQAFSLPAQSLAFTEDGSTLAIGCRMQSLKLWDLREGHEQLKRLPGRLSQAASLAFSPESKLLATGGRNSPIWIWPIAEEEPLDVRRELLSEEWGNMVFSPDSQTIAAGCKGDVIKVWNVHDFSLKTLLEHSRYVVAFTPEGKNLLTASEAEAPRWLNLETGAATPVPHYSGSMSNRVSAVDLSPDRHIAALGHKNGTLQLLEIASGREIARWKGHSDEVRSVAFSPDGRTLVTGGRDRAMILWDIATQRRLAANDEHKGAVCAVAYSGDGQWIASGCGAGTIKLWKPARLGEKSVASISYISDAIRTLAFSPDGRTLASGSEDNIVKLWSIHLLEEIASLHQDGPSRLVRFSPDGNTLATVTDLGTLRLYRTASLQEADEDPSNR